MKKYIILLLASVCFAVSPKDSEAFKSGFNAGLEVFLFQLSNEGISYKKAEFPANGFIVYANTKDLPIAEILYLQYLANRDNFKTLISKDEIIFGYFDREADAKDAATRIYKLYDINVKIADSTKEFYINPILISKAYQAFINEAKNNGNYIYTDVITIEPPKKIIANTPKQATKKYFTLKHILTQSYKNDGDEKDSSFYIESEMIRAKNRYEMHKKITTNAGESFYKVKSKNLYFSSEDVEEK